MTLIYLARKYPRQLDELARYLAQPELPHLVRHFLYQSLHPNVDPGDFPDNLPDITSRISVFHSATALFYAPSDLSGIGGMLKEYIRSSARPWRGGLPRRDCIVAEKDANLPGLRGIYVARVLLWFSFVAGSVTYPCALVHWFSPVSDHPCDQTGMWVVKPDKDQAGNRVPGVIHVDSILRGVHLIPVYGDDYIPRKVSLENSLDLYKAYYVNKFADHHSHEVVF